MSTVITASRRTDLAGCYTARLAADIVAGEAIVPQPYSGRTRVVSLRPSDVHTIVLLSKDLGPLLRNEHGLMDAIGRYEQVVCQLTITGLGGTTIEPGVPPMDEVLAQIDPLAHWLGDRRRLSVRFDPIVHWREDGRVRSNVGCAAAVLTACAAAGVTTMRLSFATIYRKMQGRGVEWLDPPQDEKRALAEAIVLQARDHGVAVHGCCQPYLLGTGVVLSGCIDGPSLAATHPSRSQAATGRAQGQRPDCLCTPSVDIGSYSQPCPHGCRYCYARPLTRA